ncbi:MAG TPA: CehA/McbA family metallohydrolase [Terriglobales bacterium]|nr:CehA/McbA family metallohydrolase [Terriglobales bacterium]
MSTAHRFILSIIVCCLALPAFTQQREPVLKQIDLPHPYYFREMYLPQLTSGPSAVAWTPDSRSVVYSMAGSLWRQGIRDSTAEQLTWGEGYDYQPDCSHDGHWVVYASYLKDAVELWALNMHTRQTRQLTANGAVNLEPRFSPDGKRLAFVSSSYKGHFHIFTADFDNGELSHVERLTGETRSTLPRYYYSAFDHEISPAWSPDGSEIVYVSNRGHIYGTGGFWRMKAASGAFPREIHYEETAWKARPEFSPDGKRLVYASYLGQAWHQLWIMPSEGGSSFPLSYGSFDNINPRWSPDGKSIAFISNRRGNTSLWVQEVLSGGQKEIQARERKYLKPAGHLQVHVLDKAGRETTARIFITGSDGRSYAPDDAWIHADDNFVHSERPFEAHYFHTAGVAQVAVPVGTSTVEVMKGFDNKFEVRRVTVAEGKTADVTIRLQPLDLPQSPKSKWVSGDVHVHMNYGGAYRNTPEHLLSQAAAENLSIVEDLVVNKEQRVPDIAYFSTRQDPASTAANVLLHGQEFHTSYWGHLGLLNLTEHFIIPDYAGYPGTAAASLFPPNAVVADMAHEQQALVGYVHPYDPIPPDPDKDESLTHELPVDVALGKVDYIEVMGFSDPKGTATVWYRLLNCGFRLPTAGGTDAMANFASLRGPVGLNRVYAQVPAGKLDVHPWLDSIKHGKTFATNGPLLGFSLGERELGDELKLPAGENKVHFKAWLRSFVPVDHLQVICDGKVAQDLKTSPDYEAADAEGVLTISHSGWCLLRAFSDKAEHPILDAYPYATTSPVYITVAGSKTQSAEDVAYFVKWIDRMTESVKTNKDWNTEAEKKAVLDLLAYARKVYENMAGAGTN